MFLAATGLFWFGPSSPTSATPEKDFAEVVSGRYVLGNPCPAGTEAGECADLTVVRMQVSLYQLIGTVERPSSGLKRNGHSSFQKFHGAFAEEGPASGRAFRGGTVAAFPPVGNCDSKTLRQPLPATGRFVQEDGKRYLEVEYNYQALDEATCALGGPIKPTKERWYRVGD